MIRGELDALTFKNGISVATDDVSGTKLAPTFVRLARDEEFAYFMKRGVYKVVPRSHQRPVSGKVIGTRRVDTNKADTEVPDCRSPSVGG